DRLLAPRRRPARRLRRGPSPDRRAHRLRGGAPRAVRDLPGPPGAGRRRAAAGRRVGRGRRHDRRAPQERPRAPARPARRRGGHRTAARRHALPAAVVDHGDRDRAGPGAAGGAQRGPRDRRVPGPGAGAAGGGGRRGLRPAHRSAARGHRGRAVLVVPAAARPQRGRRRRHPGARGAGDRARPVHTSGGRCLAASGPGPELLVPRAGHAGGPRRLQRRPRGRLAAARPVRARSGARPPRRRHCRPPAALPRPARPRRRRPAVAAPCAPRLREPRM
ncbi:MAG: hypothetical protein AVDCRST_MAG07-3432, partial [uncultured Frankineae bacterium]